MSIQLGEGKERRIMAKLSESSTSTFPRIDRAGFQALIDLLRNLGYTVIGPRIRDGAIVYEEVQSSVDFPVGWTDEQEGGKYRLKKKKNSTWFCYTAGPQSWKKYLWPAQQYLWKAERNEAGFQINGNHTEARPYAFIGVRPCELAALAIHDRVFLQGPFRDPGYQGHREKLFVVAVNCVKAGGTCFCASLKTGPKAEAGFDLALTELYEGDRHDFLVEAGSEHGREILRQIPHEMAPKKDVDLAESLLHKSAASMGRTLDTEGLKEMLYRNLEHPLWDEIASRCLSCGNCTLVCPTCFCTSVEDSTSLTGDHAERRRNWDSCFTLEFSYIHGGSVRASPKARFRQWMSHKLATWQDQFGLPGCVGCGRCITWCPVGIDITREAQALRDSERPTGKSRGGA